MGSGVSSLARLRKTLVIRSYNTREKDQTMEEQFIVHSFSRDGKTRIRIEDIKQTLSVDAPWVDELFQTLLGSYSKENHDIEFDHFIEFLETGQYLPIKESWKNGEAPPHIKAHALRTQTYKSKVPPPIAVNHAMPAGLPPTPPGGMSGMSHFPGTDKENSANAIDGGHRSGMPSVGEEASLSSEGSQRVRDMLGVPKENDMQVALRDRVGDLQADVKAMWRKSEIVKQERIVSYTTIDAAGQTQELTEKEMTQTEVLHMECRDTGEFAHRETTTFEQVETFNNETVNEESGKEEYVHLKSLDDEFEYMDSNMPQRGAPPEQTQMPDGPQSPRVEGGAGAGEGDEPAHMHMPQEGANMQDTTDMGDEGEGDDLSMKGSISPMQQQSPQAFPLGEGGDGVTSPLYMKAPGENMTYPHDYYQDGAQGQGPDDPMFFNDGAPTRSAGAGGIDLAAAARAAQAGQLSEEEMAAIYAQAQAEAMAEMEALAREEALLAAQEKAEADAFRDMRAAQTGATVDDVPAAGPAVEKLDDDVEDECQGDAGCGPEPMPNHEGKEVQEDAVHLSPKNEEMLEESADFADID